MYIENYCEELKGGYCIAKFDVRTDKGIIYRQLQLCKSKKGHLFAKWPSFGKPSPDDPSKKVWFSYTQFPEELEKDFFRKVLDALKPFIANQSTTPF